MNTIHAIYIAIKILYLIKMSIDDGLILALDENDNIVIELMDTSASLGCVPDMSNYIPTFYNAIIPTFKCCQPTGNQIYASAYATAQGFNLAATGIPSVVQSQLESWFARIAFVLILPWAIILVALFIYFMVTHVMSFAAGMAFISVTVLLAIIALAWIFYDALNTSGNIYNSVVNGFRNNWTANKDAITGHILNAYLLNPGAMCNPNEQLACCGFDYDQCEGGCDISILVDPEFVLTNATGLLSIELVNNSNTDFPNGGTLFIPPQLNGGTGLTITIPSFNTNEMFDTTIIYNTTGAMPGIVDVTANFVSGSINITVIDSVTIIGDSDPVITPGNIELIRGLNKGKKSCRSCVK